MDQRTLIISCVEYYSHAKIITGPMMFKSFEETEILSLLLESLKQFPQMDMGFFLGVIDGVLAQGSYLADCNFPGSQERIAKICEVVAMLAKKHKMNDLEACQMYYSSKTAETIDIEQKSAQEIYDLIEAE